MKRAGLLMLAAAAVVAGGGALIAATWHLSYGHGLYCAIGTASTVGCDVTPPGPAGRWAATLLMLTAIPLLASVFALVTGAHVHRRVRRHVEAMVAESQARGGSTPFTSRERPDGPPATGGGRR